MVRRRYAEVFFIYIFVLTTQNSVLNSTEIEIHHLTYELLLVVLRLLTVEQGGHSCSSPGYLCFKIIKIVSIFTHDANGKALSLLSALRMVDVRPGVEKEGTRWGV